MVRNGIVGWMFLGLWLLFATQVDAGSAAGEFDELGQVHWLRDYEVARTRSAREGKPIFLLFQEVPGCETCVSFGEEVLSHPLLVEAIEDEFIPLAILNNKPGDDRRILEQFGEPAWNNPVVRFIGQGEKDLIARRDRIWQSSEIATRMTQALQVAERPVPDYLVALQGELAPQTIERATLAMGCYWAGEACLGTLPGLLSSRVGDLSGREVVELKFDGTRLSYRELLTRARRLGCADSVFAHGEDQLTIAREVFGTAAQTAKGLATDASARNQKYHLKRNATLGDIAQLDLTPGQATRLNHISWANVSNAAKPANKDDPRTVLSPRQIKALR